MLVLLQAAHERLIDFDRAGKPHDVRSPGFPNPVAEMPGGFLRDTEQLAELDAGDAFRVGGDRYEASTQVWKPRCESCSTEPVRAEKYLRQVRQR